MICPNCGKECPDSSVFCGGCGTPLQSANTAPAETPADSDQTVYAGAEAPANDPSATVYAEPEAPASDPYGEDERTESDQCEGDGQEP